MTLVASAALFGAAGYWLDSTIDTLPAFLLVGLLVGVAGGFLHLISRLAPELLPFGNSRSKNESGSDIDSTDDPED